MFVPYFDCVVRRTFITKSARNFLGTRNKQHINIKNDMIDLSNRIPIGMYRSVKPCNTMQNLHPVMDASLTGCRRMIICPFSTERRIPNGMPKTVIYFFIFHSLINNKSNEKDNH